MNTSAYRWQGVTPVADPARRAALAARLAQALETFGDEARAALHDLLGRCTDQKVDDAGLSAALSACAAALAAPATDRLEPRRGLLRLFDSRKRRLEALRDAFRRGDAGLAREAEALAAWLTDAAKRSEALETLRGELTDAWRDLEAHLEVLADRSDEAAASQTVLLARWRDAARAALADLRIAQSVEAGLSAAINAATDALPGWRDAWKAQLGLGGRRPRRVRPSAADLDAARAPLGSRLKAATDALEPARARRAEIDARFKALQARL